MPVVDGEILDGPTPRDAQTWDTTIEVGPAGGDKKAAYDEAEAALMDAGSSRTTPKIDNGTGIVGNYATAAYIVDLAVTDSNGIVVNYLVAPK